MSTCRGINEQLPRPETQQVHVPRGAVGHVVPEGKQHRPLEQELIAVLRDPDPIQQALPAEAVQHRIEGLLLLPGPVQQSLPDRRGQVGLHRRASR